MLLFQCKICRTQPDRFKLRRTARMIQMAVGQPDPIGRCDILLHKASQIADAKTRVQQDCFVGPLNQIDTDSAGKNDPADVPRY